MKIPLLGIYNKNEHQNKSVTKLVMEISIIQINIINNQHEIISSI